MEGKVSVYNENRNAILYCFSGSSHLFSINDNKMKSPEILKAELKSINIQKRGGVVDECCVRSCTFETLQSYCLHPQAETQNSVSFHFFSKDSLMPFSAMKVFIHKPFQSIGYNFFYIRNLK